MFLDELPASLRVAVHDVTLLRRVTLPTLTALTAVRRHDAAGGGRGHLAGVARLAFVSTSTVGLELDRVVQDVIEASVELREPSAPGASARSPALSPSTKRPVPPGSEFTAASCTSCRTPSSAMRSPAAGSAVRHRRGALADRCPGRSARRVDRRHRLGSVRSPHGGKRTRRVSVLRAAYGSVRGMAIITVRPARPRSPIVIPRWRESPSISSVAGCAPASVRSSSAEC